MCSCWYGTLFFVCGLSVSLPLQYVVFGCRTRKFLHVVVVLRIDGFCTPVKSCYNTTSS